jgi:hypothetical protein
MFTRAQFLRLSSVAAAALALVFQDDSGTVQTVYTDFTWIAARHGIVNRDEQFKMASMVIASITSSVSG